MNKFKTLLKNTFSYVGGLFSTHPVTFCSICAGTLLAFFLSFHVTRAFESGFLASEATGTLFEQLIVATVIFCMIAFFMESSPLKQRMPLYVSIPVYVITALFSFGLGSLFFCVLSSGREKDMLLYRTCVDYRSLLGDARIASVTIGLCIIMGLLGVYFSFRKLEDVSFSGYLANIFSKLFFAHIVFFVLIAGVASLTGIFTSLLWGDFFEIFAAAFALIYGGYMIMRMVSCFTEEVQEPNTFIAVLLRYVLMSMYIAAYVIIYIYMVKITVMRQFPSNAVFGILTSLFVFSIPVAYMSRSFENTAKFFAWTATAMPFIFAPFIVLQIYTVFVRIRQYGLTQNRYFGLLFILFEIIYIVVYALFLKNREKQMSIITLVLAGCTLFATWIPFVNALDLSRHMQVKSIRSFINDGGVMTDDNKNLASRASAAYNYLFENDRDYLDLSFSREERADLQAKLQAKDPSHDPVNYHWFIWNAEENSVDLDVSGFGHIRYAYFAAIGMRGDEIDDTLRADLKHATLYFNEDNRLLTYVDARDLIGSGSPVAEEDLNEYAAFFVDLASRNETNAVNDMEYNAAMKDNQTITLHDGSKFYVTRAEARFDSSTEDVLEFLLGGYYLTK